MFAAASPAAGGAACFVAPVCGAACAVRSGAPARRSPDRRADERSSAASARQHTRRSRAPPRRVFASARRSRRAALVDGRTASRSGSRGPLLRTKKTRFSRGFFRCHRCGRDARECGRRARGRRHTHRRRPARARSRMRESRGRFARGRTSRRRAAEKGSRSFAQIGLCDAKSDRASGRNFFFLRRPPNASSQCATDAMRACENLRRDFVECAETRARLGFQRDRKKNFHARSGFAHGFVVRADDVFGTASRRDGRKEKSAGLLTVRKSVIRFRPADVSCRRE